MTTTIVSPFHRTAASRHLIIAMLGLAAMASCTNEPLSTTDMELNVSPPPNAARGIDVACNSSNGNQCQGQQFLIDWTQVAASGVTFAFIKASQRDFSDFQFSFNWPRARTNHIVRGAYHFFDPGVSAQTQINIFLNTLGTLQADDLPAVLDLEVAPTAPVADTFQKILQWLQAVEASTHKTPIVYTFFSYLDSFRNANVDVSALARYPLWIACPTDVPSPCGSAPIPAPWSNMKVWQNKWHSTVPGIHYEVDGDLFNGTLADLKAFAGGAPSAPNVCATLGTGDNCGTIANGGVSGTLYHCVNGVTQSISPCQAGCQIMPVGTRDYCINGNPCATLGTGGNCGTPTNHGAAGTLYHCTNSTISSTQACSSGCQVESVGIDDYCIATNPCATLGTGKNCGTPTNHGALAILYGCVNSTTQSRTTCANGCQVAPLGSDDFCK